MVENEQMIQEKNKSYAEIMKGICRKSPKLTQMGLRKPRKCSIIKKSKVLLANNRLTKGSNG